jgi:LuxR family maltose regulon positive regulatory protein
MFREIGRSTLARYHLARGEPEQSIGILEPLLEAGQADSAWSRPAELLALRALAHQARGDAARALVDIDRALELAEPEGSVRTFLEEGEPMRRLLSEASRGGRAQAYARHLLGFMQAGPPRPAPRAQPAAPDLAEPLTERELEVLRLLRSSLTTPEMAAQLGIAPSTVRTFVKSVYGKLGVHRRLEAIERAEDIGLLKA